MTVNPLIVQDARCIKFLCLCSDYSRFFHHNFSGLSRLHVRNNTSVYLCVGAPLYGLCGLGIITPSKYNLVRRVLGRKFCFSVNTRQTRITMPPGINLQQGHPFKFRRKCKNRLRFRVGKCPIPLFHHINSLVSRINVQNLQGIPFILRFEGDTVMAIIPAQGVHSKPNYASIKRFHESNKPVRTASQGQGGFLESSFFEPKWFHRIALRKLAVNQYVHANRHIDFKTHMGSTQHLPFLLRKLRHYLINTEFIQFFQRHCIGKAFPCARHHIMYRRKLMGGHP